MKVLKKISAKEDQTLTHIVNEKTGRVRCAPWPNTESLNWEVQEMEENVYLKDGNTCLTCWKNFERARGEGGLRSHQIKKGDRK